MTLGAHQEAFARDLVKLIQYAYTLGYQCRIGEVYRTPEQQALHVKAGRSKTMNSMHLKKCAADMHWFINGKGPLYPRDLGDYWESLDPLNSWGWNWKRFVDQPHFERRA